MSALDIDRYTLRVLISSVPHETGDIQLWQGYDPILDRPVSIRLVPADHPRARAVAEAARAAALVDDRRLVAVLDVLDSIDIVVSSGADEPSADADADAAPSPAATPAPRAHLVVVCEWVEGATLADLIEDRDGETLSAEESVDIAHQAALTLEVAHRHGVVHGRLRPASLLIATDGTVRIRGLAIDAALWGGEESATVDPDVHGVGSLLYAAVTGRWPSGLADGVSAAPRLGGRLVPPSQVVAEVPRSLDDIAWRSLDPRVIGDDALPRGLVPFPDIAAQSTALGAALGDSTRAPRALTSLAVRPARPRTAGSRGSGRALRRTAAGLGAAALIAGIAVVGVQVTRSAPSPWGVASEPVAVDVLTAAPEARGAGELADLSAGQVPGSYRIESVTDFDPFGDGSENADETDSVVDGNPVTSWTTETYYSPDFYGEGGIRAGVGIVLDLGEPRPVSAVRLDLEGFGSDVDVRVGSSPDSEPVRWVPLAAAEGVGETIDLRAPRPVVGQYVLVWFTRLPADSGAFRGGIREVSVLA